MSRKVAEAVVTIARESGIGPGQLSELILAVTEDGSTTVAELQEATKP